MRKISYEEMAKNIIAMHKSGLMSDNSFYDTMDRLTDKLLVDTNISSAYFAEISNLFLEYMDEIIRR